MNTGIFDCGRLRQISLRVATVVLAEHSFDVPLHKKTFPSEMSGCNQSLLQMIKRDRQSCRYKREKGNI